MLIQKVRDPGDSGSSHNLLLGYVLLRCAPKIRRRFKRARIIEQLRSLTKAEVQASTVVLNNTVLSDNSCTFLRQLLRDCTGMQPPIVFPELQSLVARTQGAVYSSALAYVFHLLLLFVIEQASDHLGDLAEMVQLPMPPEDSKEMRQRLKASAQWITTFHDMLNDGDIWEVHIGAILTHEKGDEKGNEKGGTGQGNYTPHDNDENPTEYDESEEEDEEEEEEEEFFSSHLTATGGMASRQDVSNNQAIPKTLRALRRLTAHIQAVTSICYAVKSGRSPIYLSNISIKVACVPLPTEIVSMDHWKDALRSIYHDWSSYQEAEATITEWVQQSCTKGIKQFFAVKEQTFSGTCHAEAILATLKWHSQSAVGRGEMTPGAPPSQLSDETIQQFRNTYNLVGVSKRCCPVCSKMLALLSVYPFATGNESEGATALGPLVTTASHANIYATALPPFLPSAVGRQIVQWLEKILRETLKPLIISHRSRKRAKSLSPSSSNSDAASPDWLANEENEAALKLSRNFEEW